MAMVRELDEGTVDFRPTYDGESEEPVVLPALLPGLLLNGTTGIAVGMATNMPTHNLDELYAAIKLVMTKRRPRPTNDELLALCPGPDFPSGGIVVDDGIREAYETESGPGPRSNPSAATGRRSSSRNFPTSSVPNGSSPSSRNSMRPGALSASTTSRT